MNKYNVSWVVVALAFFAVAANARVVPPRYYDFGSYQVEKSYRLHTDSLTRKAESILTDIFDNYPIGAGLDKGAVLKAKIEFLTGNAKLADLQLREFVKNKKFSPFRAQAGALRAYIAFELGDYNKAYKLFGEAKEYCEIEYSLRKDEYFKSLAQKCLFWGGVSLCQKGKYRDAKPLFEECFVKYGDYQYADDALYSLGLIEETDQNYELAINYYNTLAKKYPHSNVYIASRVREINNKLVLRRPYKALDVLENAQNALSHILIGDSIGGLYPKQDYIEAAGEELQYLEGEAYNVAGKYNQAVLSFDTFLGTYGNSSHEGRVKLALGWARLNLGENNKALERYREILSEESKATQNIKDIARLYEAVSIKRTGDRNRAKKAFSTLSARLGYPYTGQALLELGQMNYEEGQFDNARRILERADRESTEGLTSTRVHLLLGASYMELRRWSKAVSEYSNAEKLALKSSEKYMPKKEWYIAEARLKKGVSLVQAYRNAEAISVLNLFIGDNKGGKRMEEALFWLAEAYYRSDMLNSAAQTYQSLLDLYPKTNRREEVLYGLGWSYFRLKKFAKSSEIFDKMASEYPNSSFVLEALARQADGYYVTKNYARAADTYKKAANYAPKTDEGQYCAYQLCHALYRIGSYERAITSLLTFVRKYPRSEFAPYSLYLIGWIRFQQKDYSEAIDNFKFLIQAYSQHNLTVRAQYAIGDAYYNSGAYEKAVTAYKAVVENYPSNALAPEAWKSLQYCYRALGQDEKAMQIADSVINKHPESPFAQELKFKKADMFYSGKNYKDAVDEYQNFIDKYPGSERGAEALYWKGRSYVNLNQPGKAIKAFDRIRKEYPKSNYAALGLLKNGLLRKKLNKVNQADSLFKLVEKTYPKHQSAAQAGFERAALKYELGDTTEAINHYKRVAAEYAGMEYADQSRYRIANFYRSKNMLDSARQYYKMAANSASDPLLAAECQYRVGETYMRDTMWTQAAEAFNSVREKYAGVETWYPLSLLNLGETYEKLGKLEKAKEIYNALLSQRPEDEYGRTVKLRLERLKKKLSE